MSSNSIPPSLPSKVESRHLPPTIRLPTEMHASSIGLSNLATLVVEVAETIPEVAGVRLWQMGDGAPTIWHERGTVPVLDRSAIGKFSPDVAASMGA
ncbi:MAG TPA: hypothetical protein VEI49_07595, partial [Terriglobales bacterium]|nr:hypothetical protein [Terriglobales bacterium]